MRAKCVIDVMNSEVGVIEDGERERWVNYDCK